MIGDIEPKKMKHMFNFASYAVDIVYLAQVSYTLWLLPI